MKIDVFGGAGEIGGNMILVTGEKEKFFLDFGKSFSREGEYFAEFVNARKSNGLKDFLALKLVPWLPGLYRNDYLEHDKLPTSKTPEFDGIIVSHPHLDHTGYIYLVHESIPIYCSSICKSVLQAIEDTSGSAGDLIRMTRTFGYYTNKTGGLSRLRYCKDPAIKCIDRDFPVNKSKGKFQLKGIEGKMFPVDHSIIGASGYILHIDGKTIAYTGDIRFHGVRGDQTEAFVSAMVSEKIDVLITEGTNVGGTDKSPITEGQVEASIMKMIAGAGDKHVFASFPVRDTDRLMSFYRAAKAAGRKLAISAGQAYLLDMLSKNKDVEVGEDKDIVKSSDKHLAIYLKKKVYGLIGDDSVNIAERRSDYESPEAEYVGTANQICWKDVRDDPDGYVMCLDNFSVQELVDIKPKEGSLYIKSTTDPLDVEMEIDWERMMNWLKLFNIRVEKAHASGHIFEKELKEILERVNAKKVIPVHTNHPEWFT